MRFSNAPEVLTSVAELRDDCMDLVRLLWPSHEGDLAPIADEAIAAELRVHPFDEGTPFVTMKVRSRVLGRARRLVGEHRERAQVEQTIRRF